MPCSRCGAQFREDPSCGKGEHLDLPSRGDVRDEDPRKPHPAANPPLVKLAAQIQVGEYFHDLWILTGANLEGEDPPDIAERVVHVISKWGEIYVEDEDQHGPNVLHDEFTDAQLVGALLHRMTKGEVVEITPELITDLKEDGFLD